MKLQKDEETINERIAIYRKLKKYSQADMAEVLNMKTSTYSQKERNGKIDCEFVIEIAKFFDVDVRFFLFGGETYYKRKFNDPLVKQRRSIRTRFLRDDFHLCYVKILANPSGFAAFYAVPMQKSAP